MMMRDLVLDLRQAIRLLRRQPGFTVFATLTLAIGIGASTLVFTLVHAVLLRAMPFEDPDRVVWMYNARTERDRAPFSMPDLEDYRAARTLQDFAVFTNWTANLTGSGAPERLEATRVSGNFFPLLGTKPLLGRTFTPADEDGDARVVVLTSGLWTRRFGSDPGLLGQPIMLNGAAYTVIGVLPRDFLFPFRDAELAVPTTLRSDPRRADRGANFLRVVARLAPGATVTQAKADLDAIAHRLQRLYPDPDSRKTGVNLYPLHQEIVRDYRQMLWTVLAAVGVLLAVGCGNLANMMLVRAVSRRNELALRAAIGASRGRIIRQLTVEALLLAGCGGAAGVVLANVGLSVWQAIGPINFPHRDDIAIDGRVLAFAIGVSCLAALVCGLIPARSATADLVTGVAGESRTLTGSRRQGRLRRGFVMLQIAGAVVLLVAMALSARSVARLARVDAGFAPDRVLTLQLSLPPRVYTDRAAIWRFFEATRERVLAIAGTQQTGAISLRPLSGLLSTMDVAFPDRPAPPPDEVPQAHFRIASPGYFAAAGIPVRAGREFTDRDLADRPLVAMVSRTFAERHWPGESAIGKPVQIVQSAPWPPMEVVGVVQDVKQFGLDGPATADLYVPLAQMPASQVPLIAARMYWVVRTAGDLRTVGAQLQNAVQAIDPDVATSSLQPMNDLLSSSLSTWRANVQLLETFGYVAALLCAIGVYAITTFSVAMRRRELAIRTAFGASRRDLIAVVLRQEIKPVAAGIVLGLCAALATAPQLGSLLFDTSPTDVTIYVVVAGSMLALGVLACYVPTRRASASDPVAILQA